MEKDPFAKTTNELKKGTKVLLRSDLVGELVDNMKGVKRRVKVSEPIKDEGSIWAYKIIQF